MNNDEAKFILQAYRPCGSDADDPQIAKALEQVRRDPALARWFDEQQRFDAAMARHLMADPVPVELRAAILAGGKVTAYPFWRRHVGWLAAAAAVVLLLGLLAVWNRPPSSTQTTVRYQQELLQLAAQGPHVDAMAKSYAQIRDWLRERNLPSDPAIPARLQSLPFEGCRVLTWQGRRVTMLCFHLDGQHVDLFVFFDRAGALSIPATKQPQFARVGELTTAAWSRDGRNYLLAGKFDQQTLARYL